MISKKDIHEFIDETKKCGHSLVMICVPEFDDGYYRVTTLDNEFEPQKIDELLDGIRMAQDALVKRKTFLSTQNKP